ncbi:MAG TPA: FadR/GntR family transcriptional regulator [Nitrospinota bacterium]|nr:FadR/GntR family transcriptional regulator [Nitrospinota bacterium]
MKIVEQVRDLIKEGRLKPGDKLPPEQVLAEEFGTSRPSVREALSALEILGITESRGGKGNFIKNNLNFPLYEQKFRELEEEESPFELLEARKAVETEIVGLAAKKATEEEIAAIQGSLNKMKGAMTNIPEIMEFDREFHINIARAAHNNLLFSMMIYLTDLLKEKLWINLKEKSWSIPGHPQKYFEEHNEILNAIKNKDGKGARNRMYDHLAGVERDLLNE